MNKIDIKIDIDSLAQSIEKVLTSTVGLGVSPLAKIVANSILETEPYIKEVVKDITESFIDGPDFRKKITEIYKDALFSEADRMGRKAARAIINSKDDTTI